MISGFFHVQEFKLSLRLSFCPRVSAWLILDGVTRNFVLETNENLKRSKVGCNRAKISSFSHLTVSEDSK